MQLDSLRAEAHHHMARRRGHGPCSRKLQSGPIWFLAIRAFTVRIVTAFDGNCQ